METNKRYFHHSDALQASNAVVNLLLDGMWKDVYFGVWRDVFERMKRRVISAQKDKSK